jgi:hypothetical protein
MSADWRIGGHARTHNTPPLKEWRCVMCAGVGRGREGGCGKRVAFVAGMWYVYMWCDHGVVVVCNLDEGFVKHERSCKKSRTIPE